jgi:biopolymer transport protein ExbD
MSKRRRSHGSEHPEEFDLLPFANFFLLLVPFLLALAVWQKFAVIDIKLSESGDPSEAPPSDVVDQNLNLAVTIAKDMEPSHQKDGTFGKMFFEVTMNTGSEEGGSAFPRIYFDEKVTYRCQKDKKAQTVLMDDFRDWDGTRYVVKALCEDKKTKASMPDIENIKLVYLGADEKGVLDRNKVHYVLREFTSKQPLFQIGERHKFFKHESLVLLPDAKEIPEGNSKIPFVDLKPFMGKEFLAPIVGYLKMGDSSELFKLKMMAPEAYPVTVSPILDEKGDTTNRAEVIKNKLEQIRGRQMNVAEYAKSEVRADTLTAQDKLAELLLGARNLLNESQIAGRNVCQWGPGITKARTEAGEEVVDVLDPTCYYAHKLIVVPGFNVPYDYITKVMDVSRTLGFDQIEFGALK